MQFNLLSLRTFLVLLTASILIIGCGTLGYTKEKTTAANTKDSLSISAKFKASYADSKESGYFVINKSEERIRFVIGKNFLLPEKEFLFSPNEIIDFNVLISSQTDKSFHGSDYSMISINELLEILTGFSDLNINNFNIHYSNPLEKDSKSEILKTITISNNNFKIEIFIQSIY